MLISLSNFQFCSKMVNYLFSAFFGSHLVTIATVKVKVRTYDGGNGNHSVSLPIILIKIKVDQMLPFSYISSLLVSIL